MNSLDSDVFNLLNPPTEFTACVERGFLIVKRSDLVHLMFKLQDFVALHSWVNDGFGRIEITLARGVVTTEYDTLDKWKSVLRLVQKIIGEYV